MGESELFPVVATSNPKLAAHYTERFGNKETEPIVSALENLHYQQGGAPHVKGVYPLVGKAKKLHEVDWGHESYNHKKMRETLREAYENGSDAVAVRDIDDSLTNDPIYGDVYFFRDPGQLKSLNNNGEFSLKNKDFMKGILPYLVGTGAAGAALGLPEDAGAANGENVPADTSALDRIARQMGLGARGLMDRAGAGHGTNRGAWLKRRRWVKGPEHAPRAE